MGSDDQSKRDIAEFRVAKHTAGSSIPFDEKIRLHFSAIYSETKSVKFTKNAFSIEFSSLMYACADVADLYLANNETQPLALYDAHIIIANLYGLSIKSIIRLQPTAGEECSSELQDAFTLKLKQEAPEIHHVTGLTLLKSEVFIIIRSLEDKKSLLNLFTQQKFSFGSFKLNYIAKPRKK